VSTCIVLATYYGADIGRHLTHLLTLTSRPSLPHGWRSRDVIMDLRHRRDAGDPGNAAVLVNGVVRLYNLRRRQFVAAAPRHDVTVTSRRRDVMGTPARRSRRYRSLHFSNEISCSSCEYNCCFASPVSIA